MWSSLYNFEQQIKEQGVFFCFRGPFTQDLLVEVGAVLKRNMEQNEVGKSTIIKVFTVVVEEAQNILHYSADVMAKPNSPASDTLKMGMLVLGVNEQGYFVQCGNKIHKNDVARLRDKLDFLCSLDKSELNQHYKEHLLSKEVDESNSKGAGLGFVMIMKKVSQPVTYEFRGIDDQHDYFTFTAVI